jgi:hypothetical protein
VGRFAATNGSAGQVLARDVTDIIFPRRVTKDALLETQRFCHDEDFQLPL